MKYNLSPIYEKALKKEVHSLHPLAAFSKDHKRKFPITEDHRSPYKRDVDRIVHSKAYARYIDKTQVVYLIENDHITKRSLHVQLVSQFARGIGSILSLNTDLIEAVSLGHDVGHPPFGHEGEMYLSEISKEYGNGIFAHPLQSCRLFTEIENLNLSLAVYDGFLCHDGGMQSPKLDPRFGKTWEDHEKDKENKRLHPDENIMPGTLEASLVKICDTMSYIARDIEDAINLGIIQREELPKTPLGASNKEILEFLAQDLIQNSYEKESIALSDEAFHALKILRQFNFQNIYFDPKIKKESQKIKRSYRILFELLLDGFERKKEESYLWKNYLYNKSASYLEQSTPVQKVVDFIAGMTDTYFIRTIENLVVPKWFEMT